MFKCNVKQPADINNMALKLQSRN